MGGWWCCFKFDKDVDWLVGLESRLICFWVTFCICRLVDVTEHRVDQCLQRMDLTLYTAINTKDKTAKFFLLVNGNTARFFFID